jgi:hypothetical protein
MKERISDTDNQPFIKGGKLWSPEGVLIRVLDEQDYEYDTLANYPNHDNR